MVTLDGARKTLADRRARYINLLTDGENRRRIDGVTSLELRKLLGIDAEFTKHLTSFNTRLGVMPGGGFVHAGSATLAESDLHRSVTIGFCSLDLGNAIVRHVDHRDRDGLTVVGKDARHADLATHKA
jgi:hypothetical protein